MHPTTIDRVFPAIAFSVRDDMYAFEQQGTATLLPWLQRFTAASPAPALPVWCIGLLNVRGTVQMAVDLGYLLGYGQSDAAEGSRLIFLEHGLAQLGLLVDSEIGVRDLRPARAANESVGRPFAISSATLNGHPVTVLDGAAIISYVAEQLGAPVYTS
jgi:chemotaxis signal transduction protein